MECVVSPWGSFARRCRKIVTTVASTVLVIQEALANGSGSVVSDGSRISWMPPLGCFLKCGQSVSCFRSDPPVWGCQDHPLPVRCVRRRGSACTGKSPLLL